MALVRQRAAGDSDSQFAQDHQSPHQNQKVLFRVTLRLSFSFSEQLSFCRPEVNKLWGPLT